MSTIDLYTFSNNDSRYFAPRIMFSYSESGTGNQWNVWASAGYSYLYRISEQLDGVDLADRKRDAEYMIRRLQSSLLIGKKGLFQYRFDGMWALDRIEIDETSMVNCVLPALEVPDYDLDVPDWFGAFSTHAHLRRAAEDAYMATVLQQESMFFLYRGFEWLKKGLGDPSWDKLGVLIDVPQRHVEHIKQAANDPAMSARHAAESGKKSYFDGEVCSSWVCGLLHAIVHVRRGLDRTFDETVKKQGDPWPI